MTGRRGLLALLLLLPAGEAVAQSTPPRQTPARRRPVRRPTPPPPAPAPAARSEPAPVPNRDLEPPVRDAGRAAPRLDPALIDPVEPRFGTAVDRNSLQAREDRLLRQPAPGARLRLPFTY